MQEECREPGGQQGFPSFQARKPDLSRGLTQTRARHYNDPRWSASRTHHRGTVMKRGSPAVSPVSHQEDVPMSWRSFLAGALLACALGIWVSAAQASAHVPSVLRAPSVVLLAVGS